MIKIALASLVSGSLVLASSTMCFKKGHLDPSTIETIPLDGGECKSQFSVSQMKEQGYNVKDIKITMGQNGMDYMYIFSKETITVGGQNPANGQALTKEQLRAYLYEIQEEEKIQTETKKRIANIADGKARYEQLCQQCHGAKGEESAYGASRVLNKMTLEQMEIAIRDYDLNDVATATAVIMKPYASMLSTEDIENIHSYLQSIK